MPKRKRTRKGLKSRRTFKRRRRGYSRRNALIKSAPGMLGKTFGKSFRYASQFTLDAAAGSPAVHTFRLNGMFDPDLTGAGHQPIGFDQLVGVFYNHYTVVGAKIKCTFMSSGSTNSGINICGIEISNSSTPTTTLNDIYEQGKTSFKYLGATTGGKPMVTITKKVSIKKMAGVNNLLDNQDYRGSVAADPAEKIYAHIFTAGITAASNPDLVYCNVLLDQFAVLNEPIPLAGS